MDALVIITMFFLTYGVMAFARNIKDLIILHCFKRLPEYEEKYVRAIVRQVLEIKELDKSLP